LRSSHFIVEFPRGPLGIGEDLDIRPVWRIRGAARTLALSATDSCRDRLAAFYHWRDRQALAAAVSIAARHPVVMKRVREWSGSEGHHDGFEEFLTELRRTTEAPAKGHGKTRRRR